VMSSIALAFSGFCRLFLLSFLFFFFNDTATTEIYTLSLHDALPIFVHHLDHRLSERGAGREPALVVVRRQVIRRHCVGAFEKARSEEHTSELQSRGHLVCRLLLEKKKVCHSHLSRDVVSQAFDLVVL